MKYSYVDTPIGRMLVTRDEQGITGLDLPNGRRPRRVLADWQRDDAAFEDVRTQLTEYFAGMRREFDLPLHMIGAAFQRRVWEALCAIPYGETTSYGKIAAAIGEPGSARAVGAANGQNPVPIIVPCHRVIGADGSLTGYGGGLPTKRWLLEHEGAQAGLFAV
jgi:methylated-DNA-[protein]-cysteine S-methyltransferase